MLSQSYDIPYMERTRQRAEARGEHAETAWVHFDETPFTPLHKPLQACRLGVITTSMPDTDTGRRDPQLISLPSLPPPRSMYTGHLDWHRSETHTEDVASFLPLEQLHSLAEDEGLFAGLTRRFHCLPADDSQSRVEQDYAPALLARLQEDDADLVLLVPMSPVAHLTVSLVSRYIEAAGLPTVILGSALDVVSHCGVPRYLHTDFPMGNPCGKPFNQDMQQEIALLALNLASEAAAPNTIRRAPFIWSQSNDWREDYTGGD